MLFEKSLTPESNSEKKGKSKGWRMGAPIPKSKGGEQMGAIRWGKSCKKYSLARPILPQLRWGIIHPETPHIQGTIQRRRMGESGSIWRLSKAKQSSAQNCYEKAIPTEIISS